MIDPAALYDAAQDALQASRNEEARRLSLQLIAAQPGFADGHFLLAMSEANAGRLEPAIGALERAINLGPRAEYLAHYAKCLVLARRDDEALHAANRAVEMQPTDALSIDTLANVYTRLGAHEKAVPLYQAAVAKRPDQKQMRFNLASALGFLGRFEEAAEHYERLIAADPDFVGAHSALSRLKKQTVESNHISRLERLLPRVHDSLEQLGVCYALAKEYEDLGDYDAAFRHLNAAKRRRKVDLGYHIDRDRAVFDRVMHCFAQNEYFSGESELTEDPVFIVGLPRTGTTLAERILSSHPLIEAAGELRAMPTAVKRLSAARSPVIHEDTFAASRDVSPAALGRLYLSLAAPHRRQNLRFTDKLPLNFFYVGFIARALPRAKIVLLRRNALDSVWSNYKHVFAPNAPYFNYSFDLLDAAAYYVLFDRLMKFWQQLFPQRILELRYESVVDDLEGEARRLVSHCELEWTDNCLRFHENESAVATPSGPQVRRPIYRTSVGRWRAYERHLGAVCEYFASHGVPV